ncbi:Thrombospondin type 3 repeat-containing protein [Sulfidibacter corallicola]|uniref:Thrombospondin type 3 repeat-containing protein n=1 Tax=Sulfidibacter corallicola TaxID=2818388 RepID=A0A8A4TWA9_SULCO|nr:thrombospondin type 3 repeat-containing protein [Sulfidibacter corallicola]QTD54246.1 thrombospondin type 3 repeat-containing protein [Sulfidibacter corallicola]
MRYLFFSLLVTAMVVAGNQPPPRLLNTDAMLFYEHSLKHLAKTDETHRSRIAFEVEDTTLFEINTSFGLVGLEGDYLLVPTSSASKIAVLRSLASQTNLRVDIFLDDELIESFGWSDFEEYNKTLKEDYDKAHLIELYKNLVPNEKVSVNHAAELKVDTLDLLARNAGKNKAGSDDCGCYQALMQCYNTCDQFKQAPSGGSGTPNHLIHCGHCDEVYAECVAQCPTSDFDGDGVPNNEDNCPHTANPGQYDCDRDGIGGACDPVNSNYMTFSTTPCHIDEDGLGGWWFRLELWVEDYQVDVSQCRKPPRYVRRLQNEVRCINQSEYQCCKGELRPEPASLCDTILENNTCQSANQ